MSRLKLRLIGPLGNHGDNYENGGCDRVGCHSRGVCRLGCGFGCCDARTMDITRKRRYSKRKTEDRYCE